jgi:dienelactone hydrolase
MKKNGIILLLLLIPALFITSCESPEDASEEYLAEQANAYVRYMTNGQYTEAYNSLEFTMWMKLTMWPITTESIWGAISSENGEVIDIVSETVDMSGDSPIVSIHTVFENNNHDINVTFTDDGKISGFDLGEFTGEIPYTITDEGIREKTIAFGSESMPLEGTLYFPEKGDNFPCVILVHDRNVGDRNGTVGQTVFFRILAQDLVKQGIAVLTYDNKMYTYEDTINTENLTVEGEVVNDVISALETVQSLEYVDGESVYILGYGEGGYFLPKIAESTPDAKGYILMAAHSSSIPDAVYNEMVTVAYSDGTITTEEQTSINDLALARSNIYYLNEYSEKTADELLNRSQDYWLSLQDYSPTDVMKTIKKPVLVIAGTRDYEIPITEFQQWQYALSSMTNVTFKEYQGLNHVFVYGEETSTEADYETQGSIDETVITDLASFITD